MPQPHYESDSLTSDDETDSTADPETDSLFDSCDDKTSATINSNKTIVVDESDSDSDASLFEDEVRHPPEYYLTAAAKVDVRRLRSRRYSPKTQDRLDWVKEHHDWYKQIIDRF
jgi:hypothetical protein